MNRNRYRLVFNATLGMMVPVCETARRQGKSGGGRGVSGGALALAGVLLAGPAWGGELPVAGANFAAPGTVANYLTNGATQAYISQVGNKAVVNFDRFNISAGHDVQVRQVHQLPAGFNDPAALVQGAQFSLLASIHDINPSVIAGSISQAAGQRANLILVNSNGIAFMNGSQVNLNSFTASTLNMQDGFLDNFLPQGSADPQFEGALDGGAARGFIKVFEGAQITAGSQGRVMLIAPTVVNKGKVTAADGQVIAAAASKVYLRSGGNALNGLLIEVDSPAGLAGFDTPNTDVKDGQLDGQTVALTHAAEDKLGHVTNLGELTTPRGNVTMVGYAVNQMGIARATTSVVAGGSVYLMAKDTATGVSTQTPGSTRAGRVTLGGGSLTEVLPEVNDTATTQDGAAGTGLERPSRVRVLGQDVRVAGADGNGAPGARIVARGGRVELLAVDNPNADYFNGGTSDMFSGGTAVSSTAKLHVGDGAHIDVSGLKDVAVSPNRAIVEIELRGDELKDSPLNQVGPLRGEKVYIDVDRALAESDAGVPTLVARDTLLGLKAQQQRTVAERSTAGGSVLMASRGEAVIESGVTVDLSGGNLKTLPGQVKTTMFSTNGDPVDASDARADVRYTGITTRYVIDYGIWNRQEVIDLGQSFRFAEADVLGQNAGVLETFGTGGLFAQPDIVGATTTGIRQRDLGLAPRGARWVVGYDDTTAADKNQFAATGYTTQDYKLNQDVILANAAAALPAGFRAGDALPANLKATLNVDTRLVDSGRVAELSVLSNQALAVRDAIRAPVGGAITLTAADVNIAADLVSQGGSVAVTARNTAGRLADVLPAPQLTVADGVHIATHGNWVNDLPGTAGAGTAPVALNGGRIALRAESISDGPGSFVSRGQITLGNGVELDADSGARLTAAGKQVGGRGGDIELAGFGIAGFDTASIHAYGVDKGGTLSLGANRIEVAGSSAPAADLLALDSGVFGRGGFARTTLHALTRLDIAPGADLAPTLVSRDLDASTATRASGADLAGFSALTVRDATVRQAIDLVLRARQNTAESGDLVVGTGARIALDPGAKLTLDAFNRVGIDGSLTAQGGSISASSDRDLALGANTTLDVSGVAQTAIQQGLRQGTVRPGGTVSLSGGRVTAEAGSHIDVSGAAPVPLDVPNETGGLGRRIGSAAGSLTVDAIGAMRLDGIFDAAGGDSSLRGGRFAASLGGEYVEPAPGQALTPLQLRVGAQVAPGQNDGQTRVDVARLDAAGFDRISLSSRDAIVLENGLDLGAGPTPAVRELTLDAAAILTAGGDSTLRADTLNVGNFDPIRRAASSAATQSGTLTLDARHLNLVGKFDLDGMATANLTGRDAIRFTGTTAGIAQPAAELRTRADLAFHGATVAPSSFTLARVVAPGRTVQFSAPAVSPVQPYSAQGGLTVEAGNIVQGGNVWAPLGQLDFRATGTLTFANGSLTSVAAAPGSLLPFGKVQNGRTWVVDLDPARVPAGQPVIDTLEDKAIRTSGASVDMQAGAKLDLAGGGDLQAYEFTVGPGGSRDILADANTYAILPGYSGGIAPADAQEKFDRASGEAVYLTGVPGLADGVYTLLPAHYALLPGAYAVKLDAGKVLPGQAYTRQDGIRVGAGYLTDTRANAPRAGDWQGIQVLTRDQVRARSEFTLTRASDFFAGAPARPQDAGLLSVAVSGAGANALKLDAIYNFAPGSGGRGAQVDISAGKLAITSGNVAGLAPDTVVLDAARLNALGADSLLLGATRSRSGDTTTLDVGTTDITLANDSSTALRAGEVMLAARDTLTLKSGSVIDAQGNAGDAGQYAIAGNGAFVRAAATRAGFSRTGSPDGSAGTLIGEAGSLVQAADSITLDATANNAFAGSTAFRKNGAGVAGRLGMGATRVHFGDAPAGSDGIVLRQADLDAINLAGLTLTSYTTFDFHGDVTVGALDGNGKPVLQELTLQGAGLAGRDNAGQTAQLNARTLTLANPDNAATYTPSGAGSGTLAVKADTLILDAGDKRIGGFGQVDITANELVGRGSGTLAVDAPLTLNVARYSGERAASQSIDAAGALVAAAHLADRTLAPTTGLGASWALKGTTVDFDSLAELGSGAFKLTATAGDVNLGAQARVDVAGRSVRFFDVEKPSWGGTAEFVSETGNVTFDGGARVDVSAAAGGDAGTLVVRASQGRFSAASGSVQGQSPLDTDGKRGEGARARVDVGTLPDFSALNASLNAGGFDGERDLRVRTGNVSVAAGDTVRAANIRLAADAGDIGVAGKLNASGDKAGRIALYAGNNLDVAASAGLDAHASDAGAAGGTIDLGSRDGTLDLAAGSQIDVSGGAGGQGGTLNLRAQRDGTDVKVGALDSTVVGADAVNLEAVQVYDNIATLTASGSSSGSTLSLTTINADNTAYAENHGTIKTRLGKTGDAHFHLLSGVEVRAPGDLTLAQDQDWNLKDSRAGGEAGVLTLRADGNLNLNANLSDGFSVATSATLLAGDSWSYRLVGGADRNAADPLATLRNETGGNVALAADKLVRTGTGDIDIAAGGNVALADANAAIYTAGRLANPLAGFTAPVAKLSASYSTGGGDVRIAARGDVTGKPSTQLFSQWLFRQGATDPATGNFVQQPSWWVRFDQFRQGVGALGGGDVTIAAGGSVRDVSASLPTQARATGTNPSNAVVSETGGGNLRLTAGGDVLGGSYYSGRGEVLVRAGGRIGANTNNNGLKPVVALGDARADLRALGDVDVGNAVTPQMLPQSADNLIIAFPVLRQPVHSLFSTFSETSAISLSSLSGDTAIQQEQKRFDNINPAWRATSLKQFLLPATLEMTSFQGEIDIGQRGGADQLLTLMPSAKGSIDLRAAGDIRFNSGLTLSDMNPAFVPNAIKPTATIANLNSAITEQVIVNPLTPSSTPNLHATVPLHRGDDVPVRVYALNGDIRGVSINSVPIVLDSAKKVDIKAGRDVSDLTLHIQHVDADDTSWIATRRDFRFSSTSVRQDNARVRVGGPGRLDLTAGRNIDLGTSGGIVSRGNLDNIALPQNGASLRLTAGAGIDGVDASGAVDRVLQRLESGQNDATTLWLARWLVGDDSLEAGSALTAVRALDAQNEAVQRDRVVNMVFTALRETGRQTNQADSGFAGDFGRGYAALELLFPGIEEKNPDGSFRHFSGDINLFASRVKTDNGGDIEFFAPAGDVIVGLPNTPAALVNVGSDVLGIVAAGSGDVQGMARGDMKVNQSRILTVGGGDVLLWSSEGDIDAGKGKKTASAVPPPIVRVDAQGNITLEQQGAVTGSGIGALFVAGGSAGDVDLIAPKGAVDAGDAGIRAGNLNIAAQVVLGADNISVSGTSTGTPVADTSAVTAASSGATNADGGMGDATAALANNLAEAARAAEELKKAFKPTFISAEVIGYGE